MSIERIKAVIAMKQLEQRMISEGKFKPNVEFVSFMEKILGAQDFAGKDKLSDIVDKISHRKPVLVAVPEGATISREEASKILSEPIPIEFVDRSADNPLIPENDVAGKIIRRDEFEVNKRFSWIFVDMSENIAPEVLFIK